VRAEDPREGEERKTTASFFTFVALDDDGRPTQVPDLVCPTEEEEALCEEAVQGRKQQFEDLVERME